MAFIAQGEIPTPTPTTLSARDQALAAIQAAGGMGAPAADSPIVPLWLARPATPMTKPTRKAAKTTKTYGRLEGNEGTMSLTPGDKWTDPNAFTSPLSSTNANLRTRAAAEMYWLGEMTDEERKAFAEKAVAAGMWEPKEGARGLIQAWAQAVGMAADYNESNAGDKDKWISPWEALDKLYAANVAANGGVMDGFAGNNGAWRSSSSKQVRTFTDDEIRQTAEQILQEELGRNPTDAEVKAYTIAANQAATLNPQTVTERTRDTAWDSEGRAIDSETERTVDGDVYDPTVTIEQQVRDTQESKLYKSATDYYSAAMQALDAIV